MSRSWFVTVMAVAAGLLAGSGRAEAQTSISRAGAVPASTRFVAIGCVDRASGSADQFVVTDYRGERPVSYRLQGGDPEQLRFHVGHTVEIVGPLSGGASGPDASRAASAGVLKVDSLIYISMTCDPPGRKEPAEK